MTDHPDFTRDRETTAREGAAGYVTHHGEYVVMVPHPNGGVVSVTGLRLDNPTVAIARVLWAGWREATWPPRTSTPVQVRPCCDSCGHPVTLCVDYLRRDQGLDQPTTQRWVCGCGATGVLS